MDKYIIFCDIDGTVVDIGGKSMSPSVIAELNRLKSHGHIPIVVTGRPYFQLESLGGVENFSYMASLFGSVIIDSNGNTKIIGHSLDVDGVKRLVKLATDNHRVWHYKNSYRSKCIINDKTTIEKYKALLVDEEEFQQDLINGNVFQLFIFGTIFENAEEMFPQFGFYQMPCNYFDVTDKRISKKIAIEYFKSLFPDYKTISIGDSDNDIDMFNNTDISISMGNAKPEIQALTTYVTLPVNQDGFTYAFNEILKL